jgi:hypothetical protein
MSGYLLWGALLTLAPTFILGAGGVLLFKRSYDWEVAGVLLAVGSGVFFLVGSLLTGVNVWEVKACEHQANRMDLNWDYSFWTPCLVELPDGRWVNVDEIENNHLTGEVTLKDDER